MEGRTRSRSIPQHQVRQKTRKICSRHKFNGKWDSQNGPRKKKSGENEKWQCKNVEEKLIIFKALKQSAETWVDAPDNKPIIIINFRGTLWNYSKEPALEE